MGIRARTKCALLAGAMLCGATSAALADDTKSYIDSAHHMMESGDYRGAKIQLLNAEDNDPKNPAICVELAKLDLLIGDFNSAEAELIAAHERGASTAVTDPLNAEALYRTGAMGELLRDIHPGNRPAVEESQVRAYLGLAELSLGDIDTASSLIMSAERLGPKVVEPKLAMARLLLVSGKTADAGRDIDRALALYPSNTELLDLKGIILSAQGSISAAFRAFDAAVAADPQNAPALLDRANLYIVVGNLAAASRDISIANNVMPDSPLGIYLSSIVHIEQQDYKDADAELAKLRPMMDQMVEAYFLAGVVKYNLDQLEQSSMFLTRYIAKRQEPAKAYALLGAIALRRGEVDDAIGYLEHGHSVDPSDTEIVGLLGQAYAEAGNETKATELIAQARQQRTGADTPEIQAGRAGNGLVELGRVFQAGQGNILAGPPLVLLALQAERYDDAIATAKILTGADPDNLYYQELLGLALLSNRDFTDAEPIFTKLVAAHPELMEPRQDLAQIYASTGRMPQARALYQNNLTANPKDEASIVALAALSARAGDHDGAIAELRKAQAVDPKTAYLSELIISNYEQETKWSDAIREAKAAQANFPDDKALYDTLAIDEAKSGDMAGALATYHAALAKFPQSTFLWAELSSAQQQSKDYAGALKSMQQASALDPKNGDYQGAIIDLIYSAHGPDAALAAARALAGKKSIDLRGLVMEAAVLERSRRYAEAIATLKAAAAQKSTTDLTMRLVEIYRTEGDVTDAIAVLEDWTKGHPSDFTARIALAQIYGSNGQFDAAQDEFEWLAKVRPSDPLILNNLAWLYNRKHDPRARTVAQKAYQLAPDQSDTADTYGWILTNDGDTADGARILQSASAEAPSDPQISYHFAVALSKVNRIEEARAELQHALQANRDFDGEADAKILLAKLGGAH